MTQQTRRFWLKVKDMGEGYPRLAWNIMLVLIFGVPIFLYDGLAAILPFLMYLTASQLLFWYAVLVIGLLNYFTFIPDESEPDNILDSKL